MSNLSTENTINNYNTLTNAVELSQCVLSKIVGGDVSTHIDGQFVGSEEMSNLITAKLQAKLSKYLIGV